MVYGIYLSAGGLQTNQYRQEVLANNLANVSTVGFKPDLSVVNERRIESNERFTDPALGDPTLDGLTGGSLVAPTYTSFEPGSIQQTGNPLDVALTDDSFFVVEDGDKQCYTRDGRFMVNAKGSLATVTGGRLVLGVDSQPIQVSQNAASRVTIDGSGRVRAGDTVFGQVGTVVFEDRTRLRKVGGNRFEAIGATPQRVEPNLRVGAVEGSGVDPLQTLVSLMQVTRAYEMNATLLGLSDSTLNRAVNDIARIR